MATVLGFMQTYNGLLLQVPALTDGWNDVKEKFNAATEDFKVCMQMHPPSSLVPPHYLLPSPPRLRTSQGVSAICESTRGGIPGNTDPRWRPPRQYRSPI